MNVVWFGLLGFILAVEVVFLAVLLVALWRRMSERRAWAVAIKRGQEAKCDTPATH